jgi:hypothetical protein
MKTFPDYIKENHEYDLFDLMNFLKQQPDTKTLRYVYDAMKSFPGVIRVYISTSEIASINKKLSVRAKTTGVEKYIKLIKSEIENFKKQ